jgi:hypothetical protein
MPIAWPPVSRIPAPPPDLPSEGGSWVIPRAEAAPLPRPWPSPPSLQFSPNFPEPDEVPPLIDIDKSPPAAGASSDDACVGAWRICHFF